MTINLNVAPYYDDYDEAKKFLKILFRPGVAVQTRELTQLQSILQNQISRFGNHIFAEGSMVIPGQVSYDADVGYVKLENLNSGSQQISNFLSEFEGTTITGSTSGVTALVLKAVAAENTDPHTLFVKYTNSGNTTSAKTFIDGEPIINNGTTPRSATLVPTNATGKGSVASIGAGIYYVYGNFVLVDAQTIVLEKYSTTPAFRIGLDVEEILVAPEDDESLNDNAQGSFNYAAPGAHRYKIELTLTKLAVDSELDQSFVELLRVRNGEIQYKVTQTDYSMLEKTLARRTYDESGDYTVRPFNIQVREHRNNNRGEWASSRAYLAGDVITSSGNYYVAKTSGTSGTSSAPTHTFGDSATPDGSVTWTFTDNPQYNRGVYDALDSNIPGDESKLAIGLEPGKAYVRGYEIEKVATEYLSIPKSREFTRTSDVKITATVGNFVLVNNITSIPENITEFPTVDLYDQLTATGGTAAGSKVGTARVRGIEYHETGVYKLFLFDVNMNAGKVFEQHAKQFYYNNTSIFDFTADIKPVLYQLTGSITAAGTAVIGTGTKFTTELSIGDYISVAGNNYRVTAIASDVGLTLGTSLTTTGSVFSKVLTQYVEPENSGLVFPLQQSAIRSIRSDDDTTIGTTYTITRNMGSSYQADGTGQVQINLVADGETFGSVADPDNYLIIRNSSGAVVTPTLALGVGSTTLTISGLTPSAYYTVIAAINKARGSAKEKTKVLQSNYQLDFTTASTATPKTLVLGKADIFRLTKVEMAASFGAFNSTGAVDVTDRYTLDNGQRFTHYDLGRLELNAGYPVPTGTLRVTFDYFTHGAGDYFSRDSYTGAIQYKDIPYVLRDSLDFRPRINDAGTGFDGTGSTTGMPKRGVDVEADYSFYLMRNDKICLNLDGNFFAIEGVPGVNPSEPADPSNGMVLHKLSLGAYTFDATSASVYVATMDNKRYTMRDIGRIEKRLENVEYYTALSLLEQETKSLTIKDEFGLDRFKNGFVVDNFEGHGVGDTTSPDYICAVDMENKQLRPFYTMGNVNLLEQNTSDALRTADGYQLTGDLITLPYTHETLVNQPYASRTENVNPFAIFTFIGTIGLNPSSDEWFEVNRRPDIIINREGNFNTIATLAERSGVLGTVWNAWQTQWTGSSSTEVGQAVYNPHSNAWTSGGATASAVAANILFSMNRPNTMARTITVATTATQVGQARTGVRTSVVAKVDTQLLEDRVLSTAVIPYIRSRNLLIVAKGLKPNTRLYPLFDDVDISQYITPATKLTYNPVSGYSSDFDFDTNVGGNASETARRINGNVDSSLNKGDVVTGLTSGATGVVAYQEVTAGGQKSIYIVNVIGTFVSGEVIRGSLGATPPRGTITGTVTTAIQGDNLVSNFNGTVVGLFNIPNTDALRFRTGTREFKLTDSATNGLDFTSQGRVQYRAQGLLETKQATIIATRNAELVQEVVNQTQTVIQTSSTVIGDTGWWDPLAQTFLVQQKGGAFITKVDVYFATKDAAIPVQLEIRETVNGYPGKKVLPLSRVIKNPNEVALSTDASAVTTFTFDSPVYLGDATEYCVVLMSDSNNYRVWISQLGEKNVGTDRFISEQPYAGVLFKSQNASTWTADQLQDLKFTVHRAKFTTGVVGTASFVNDILPLEALVENPFQTSNGSNIVRVFHRDHGMIAGSTVTISGVASGTYNNIPSTQLNGNHIISNVDFDSYTFTTTALANASGITGGLDVYATGDHRFDTIQPIVQNQVFDKTSLVFDAGLTTLGYSADAAETSVIANENNDMVSPKVIASQINETLGLGGAKSITMNAYLYTENDAVSPVIDTHRLSLITVSNRIDTPSTALNVDPLDNRTIASASSVISIDGTLERLTTSDSTMKASFATVSVGKYITISGTSSNNGSFLVTEVASDGSYITVDGNLTTESPASITIVLKEKYVAEIAPVSSSGNAKYVTNVINLKDSSTYFKVLFSYNKPQNADIKVYYKTMPVGSNASMNTLNYTLVTPSSSLLPSEDSLTFTDAEYMVENIPEFNSIQIKIVMTSTSTAAIPRVKDFRVIACA